MQSRFPVCAFDTIVLIRFACEQLLADSLGKTYSSQSLFKDTPLVQYKCLSLKLEMRLAISLLYLNTPKAMQSHSSVVGSGKDIGEVEHVNCHIARQIYKSLA